MKKTQFIVFALATALIFTILFYKKSIGINLFLFEFILIPVMIFLSRPVKFNFFTILLLASTSLTAVFTMLTATSWVIFINFSCLFTLATALNFQGSKSFLHLGIETIVRSFLSQVRVFQPWQEDDGGNRWSMRKLLYFVILPIIILLIFFFLYISSSSAFYNAFVPFFQFISKLNISLILFFILGIIVANVLIAKTNPTSIYQNDISSSDNLIRQRKKYLYPFKKDGLSVQNKAGIILLSLLNVLILVFNCVDITTIWFGFSWEGDMLKEFVHQGTWVLVFSVIISAAIALYFFNGNLNFFSKNKPLKILTITWILQNLVMMFSVIIRNYWYINYFGLAYKRIAVIFFLILVAFGLLTIIWKIVRVKSSYFLLRVNGISLLLALVFSSFFNWDMLIAKYNFKHYDRVFIEYRFMAQLNDASLPFTVKSLDELQKIDEVQQKTMPFDTQQAYYWDYTKYYEVIKTRENTFLQKQKYKSFLEWNLADYRAYKKLNE